MSPATSTTLNCLWPHQLTGENLLACPTLIRSFGIGAAFPCSRARGSGMPFAVWSRALSRAGRRFSSAKMPGASVVPAPQAVAARPAARIFNAALWPALRSNPQAVHANLVRTGLLRLSAHPQRPHARLGMLRRDDDGQHPRHPRQFACQLPSEPEPELIRYGLVHAGFGMHIFPRRSTVPDAGRYIFCTCKSSTATAACFLLIVAIALRGKPLRTSADPVMRTAGCGAWASAGWRKILRVLPACVAAPPASFRTCGSCSAV